MKSLIIEIPENVNENKFRMSIASNLFDQGILSSGQSAKLVGISKREFLENVGKYGVTIFNETKEDLSVSIEL